MTTRINNTCFQFGNDRVETPGLTAPTDSYIVANSTFSLLQSQDVPFFFSLLDRTWKVETYNPSLLQRFFQLFSFTKYYPNKEISHYVVTKVSDGINPINPAVTPCSLAFMAQAIRFFDSELASESFCDAFTELSTQYLQTVDPHFVSEQTVLASYQFRVSNKVVSLVPLQEVATEENKAAVTLFRDYIVKEFGQKRLEYVNTAYGFSLDEMIKNGDPLTPDHVFKVNIGMQNVTLQDLQTFYTNLKRWRLTVKSDPKFLEHAPFSNHDLRAIYNHLNKSSNQKLWTNFLSKLALNSDSVQDLDPDTFNLLLSFIWPTDAEREKAFTGRKITQQAIVGSNTMGEPNIFNPSRDLFELLHLYPYMQQSSWQNYFELISHVAVKKTLIRYAPEAPKKWQAGIILPAPSSSDGKKRWYINTDLLDDGYGSINYVLQPACTNYEKSLPYMKCYRSTASNGNAFDSLDSIRADLNPYGSPGSLEPIHTFKIEQKELFERTIPLWVALLIQSEKEKSLARAKEAAQEYLQCIQAPGNTPDEHLAETIKACQEYDYSDLRDHLWARASLHDEHPGKKRAQDIAFIGHSLGGALAQWALAYFAAKHRRIPLNDKNFIVYDSRGPAVNWDQDATFMQFGKAFKQTITMLGQKWKIHHDFAAGDFIPQSGHSHLGTTDHDETDTWFENKITVFKPLESATSLDITTLIAHERRREHAKEGLDYTNYNMTPSELYTYDHAWILPQRQIQIFDYTICVSAKVLEFAREFFACILSPVLSLYSLIATMITPKIIARNDFGGFRITYKKKKGVVLT